MIDCYVAYLHRLQSEEQQTLGSLVAYCGTNEIFSCKTLELPWRNNEQFISRIPPGEYRVVRRESQQYKQHWHVKDVRGRELILIHPGNFKKDSSGCILVGRDIRDIDGDGWRDVTSSKPTMRQLNNVIPVNNFKLVVV